MSGPILLILRVLMALGLYAFLAWGILTLWKELRQQGVLLASRKVPLISLTIQPEGQPPQNYHFTHSELIIGRDPLCECPLNDETASGQHARLSYHHGQWWAEDLGSTNGTMLNQEHLSVPTVVVAHDEITCGKTRLTINLPTTSLNPHTQPIQERTEKE